LDGPVIPNYYPPVVTEAEFYTARAGAASRSEYRGRVGKRPELFTGLLRHARDGDTFFASTRVNKGVRARVLINTASAEGQAKCYSFPAVTFEAAILSLLAEIDPQEILNGNNGPDETLALAGQLAGVEAKIAELEAELLKGDVAALARVLRQLEEQKKDLAGRLAAAREKAAHPLSEAWGETKPLVTTLAAAPDPADARLRLRAALRRIVNSIWLLIVPRGVDRICAVQVWFSGGKCHREYLIFHQVARGNRYGGSKGVWLVGSVPPQAKRGEWDLRKPAQAAKLEALLCKFDLANLKPGA